MIKKGKNFVTLLAVELSIKEVILVNYGPKETVYLVKESMDKIKDLGNPLRSGCPRK
uniref:Uncharacterized protein n=1 Tax=Lepeophtheirus salmonis TaxID=72036 RepID=A0A0K2U6A5_LEPSM